MSERIWNWLIVFFWTLVVILAIVWAVRANAQTYTDAFLNSVNRTWQAPCGSPGAPTAQISNSLASLTMYQGGTLDLECYQQAVSITADVFSPVSVPVTMFLPAHTVTVNANATIPSNFMICSISGGSIVAGAGYTLTNNAQSCFGGGGGSTSPGGPEYAVQFNQPLGTFDGVSNFLANSPEQDQAGLDLNSGWALEIDSTSAGNDRPDGIDVGFPIPSATAPTILVSSSGVYSGFGFDQGFEAQMADVNTPPLSTADISSVQVSNNLVTVTMTSLPNWETLMTFSGLTNATFLNGQTLYILNESNSSPWTLTGPFTHADYGPTSDTGTLTFENLSTEQGFLSSVSNNLAGDETYGFYFGPPDPACTAPVGTCNEIVGFEASQYGDGANYEYQFDAFPASFANIESADFEDEGGAGVSAAGPEIYAFKLGASGYEPDWWIYEDGSQYMRQPFIQQIGTTVGTCTMSPGLSDCVASLNSGLDGNGGPPQSETVNFVVCNTASNYDTIAWEQWGETPSCDGSSPTSPIFPLSSYVTVQIGNAIQLGFNSGTGHTLGATGSFTVTVNNGTELSPYGGSFFDSVPLAAPVAPTIAVTCPGSCTTNWTYAAVALFNGAPTELGLTATVQNAALLSGTAYNVITMPDQGLPVGATCAIMRTNDGGGSPSTTGYLTNGSGNIIMLPCDGASTIMDNGLPADGSRGPDVNTTGGIIATLFAAPIETQMQFITEGGGSNYGSFIFQDQEAALGETTGSTFTATVGSGIAFYGSAFETYLNGIEGGGQNFTFQDSGDGTFYTNDRLEIGQYQVATLAGLNDLAFPQMAWAANAASPTTCTSGGGTYHVLCAYDNSQWNALASTSSVADTTFTTGTSSLSGNTCSSASAVTMTGLTSSMAFAITPNADVSGITGWGASGGLILDAWPTSNTLNYKVCNQTALSITPGGSVTWNVSAR